MLLDTEGMLKPQAWWAGPWWSIMTKGIIAIVFGVIAVLWPGITLLTLVILFGAFFLIDGIFTIVISTKHQKIQKHWKWSLAAGIAGLVLGIIALSMPIVTEIVLIYVVATWAIIMGVLGTINAVRMRKQVNMGWPLTSGIIGIAFGTVILITPFLAALVGTEVIGFFAIFWGISLCYHSSHVWQQSKKGKGIPTKKTGNNKD